MDMDSLNDTSALSYAGGRSDTGPVGRAIDVYGMGSSPRREMVNICTDFAFQIRPPTSQRSTYVTSHAPLAS
jgi:hypothetical protein